MPRRWRSECQHASLAAPSVRISADWHLADQILVESISFVGSGIVLCLQRLPLRLKLGKVPEPNFRELQQCPMVVQRVIWLCTPMDAHEWRDLRDDARELFDRVVRATVERTTIQSQIEAEERVTYRLVEVEPGP